MLTKILELNIGKSEASELIETSKSIEKDYELLKKGYPIQYLIGYVNFYGYKININPSVLIPRYCTEELVYKTITYLKEYNINSPKVLDLCTGSGCIAITLCKEGISKDITASDISIKALEVAKMNFNANKCNIKTIKSNIFNKIKEKYDVIISNPPYVSHKEKLDKSLKYEPRLALFSENGVSHIEEIIKNIDKHTSEKAIIALEINSYSEKNITKILNKYLNDSFNYIFKNDLEGKQRFLFIFKNLN